MDKYESRVLVCTGSVLIVFLFSILWSSQKTETDIPQCIPYDTSYTIPKVSQVDSNIFQVFCVAKMWNFQPNKIEIPVGSEVDFFLTSQDCSTWISYL